MTEEESGETKTAHGGIANPVADHDGAGSPRMRDEPPASESRTVRDGDTGLVYRGICISADVARSKRRIAGTLIWVQGSFRQENHACNVREQKRQASYYGDPRQPARPHLLGRRGSGFGCDLLGGFEIEFAGAEEWEGIDDTNVIQLGNPEFGQIRGHEFLPEFF